MKQFFVRGVLLLALGASLLCACSGESLPPGVVATVNGEPITLRELEARDDARSGVMLTPLHEALTVEGLRRRYGESLSVLIAEKLMLQALSEKKLLPSTADVREAENTIRADYPDGEFEKSVQEQYADIAEWRAQLKKMLALRVFQKKVLFPRIAVSDDDVTAWYKANERQFFQLGHLEFLFFTGPDRKRVEQAREAYLAGKTPADGVTSSTLRMAPERLPTAWVESMTAAGKGKPTPVRQEEALYQFFVLTGRTEPRQLSQEEAAPLIREILAEKRAAPALEKWIEDTLSTAKIRVSSHLRAGMAESR